MSFGIIKKNKKFNESLLKYSSRFKFQRKTVVFDII